MSLAMVMLLALGLVFTSCNQPNIDLTQSDFDDTSWLIGNWRRESEIDVSYDAAGLTDAEKTVIKNEIDAQTGPYGNGEEVILNKTHADIFANLLKMFKEEKFSVKTNKDKTKISISGDSEDTIKVGAKKVTVKVSISITYTKK